MKKIIFLGLMLLMAFGMRAQTFSLPSTLPTAYASPNDGNNAGTGGTYGTYFGVRAGLSSGGVKNVYIGYECGMLMAGSSEANTFLGFQAGKNTTSGTGNVFLGASAGFNLATGISMF